MRASRSSTTRSIIFEGIVDTTDVECLPSSSCSGMIPKEMSSHLFKCFDQYIYTAIIPSRHTEAMKLPEGSRAIS